MPVSPDEKRKLADTSAQARGADHISTNYSGLAERQEIKPTSARPSPKALRNTWTSDSRRSTIWRSVGATTSGFFTESVIHFAVMRDGHIAMRDLIGSRPAAWISSSTMPLSGSSTLRRCLLVDHVVLTWSEIRIADSFSTPLLYPNLDRDAAGLVVTFAGLASLGRQPGLPQREMATVSNSVLKLFRSR